MAYDELVTILLDAEGRVYMHKGSTLQAMHLKLPEPAICLRRNGGSVEGVSGTLHQLALL